jgi:hypothetical protein
MMPSAPRRTALRHPLGALGIVMVATTLATSAGVFLDHRIVTGAPVWLKPAKFSLSVAIYSFTFQWLLGFVRSRPRAARALSSTAVVSFSIEMGIIVTQAFRGTTSHFNMSTPLDGSLWIVMGVFIAVVAVLHLLLTLLLIREPGIAPFPMAVALRLGAVISLLGMLTAIPMLIPAPGQLAVAIHGPRIIGAHSVGIPDGGRGLPILGWSIVAGDLRVPHFAGLHALQIMPMIGWLFSRRTRGLARLTVQDRTRLVAAFGVAYVGAILLLEWQALRGESLIHPGAKTILAAASLLSAFGAYMTVILMGWRSAL